MKVTFNPLAAEFQLVPDLASEIRIADVPNNYMSGNVEDALQEVAWWLGSRLSDAPHDGSSYARNNGAWTTIVGGGGGAWGTITGTLADQTDLQTELDARLLASNNLSDLTNVATARINLGLVIGTNVQAYDATLQSISSLGTVADRIAYTTNTDVWAETTLTSFGRSLIDDANAAAARTTLELVAGGSGDIWVEKAGDTMTGQLLVDLGSDVVGLRVQGSASQTANLLALENSGGTVLTRFDQLGRMLIQPPTLTATLSGNILINDTYQYYVPSSTSTAQLFGNRSRVEAGGSSIMTSAALNGYYGTAYYFGSNTLGSLYGLNFIVGNFSGGGTVTTVVGAYLKTVNNTVGCTVTTQTGIRIDTPAVVGTTVNLYGLKIENHAGASTLNFSIHTGTGDASFGDDVVLRNDNDKLRIGALSTGDLNLYHDGTNSFIYNDTGLLKIQDAGSGINVGTANTEKIALYGVTPIVQPTTAIAAATFVANSSAIADDTATFDGYTIGQVVKALRNLGVLA